jgi:hypothetical protein
MNAVISGDIVSSTALNEFELQLLRKNVIQLFDRVKGDQPEVPGDISFFGRLIKGDYIECYMKDPKDSLRVALLIKTLVKRMVLEKYSDQGLEKKRLLFKKYGVRLAIGIGSMRTVDTQQGILDGEAIYLSGRKIDDQRTRNKEKVVIKSTLFFETPDSKLKEQGSVLVDLLDVLLNNATARQCNVLYYKLLGFSELEIAQELGVNQATVNQHSTATGWNAIEHTLKYYEQLEF